MSFPDKQQRQTCWDSRDRYWHCLDDQNVKDSSERPKECAELRKLFEKSCPTQWVSHFDRKRDFEVFKQKMQKGYEPIKETHVVTSFHIFIMEELFKIVLKINIPTNELQYEVLQEVLLTAKKNSRCHGLNTLIWNEVSEILWKHLQTEFEKLDDQLLGATCFYTVLSFTDKQEFYLNEISKIIDDVIGLNKDAVSMKLSVSLMYGIFQSTFLQQNVKLASNLTTVLQSIFNLLMIMAYDYSRFTFIVFKTINSFKKVCGSDKQEFIFSKNNQMQLLSLVNQNWENPITGVRDLNKEIFQTVMYLIDESVYEIIFEEINAFYWNKAKYLSLSIIIEYGKKEVVGLIHENNWTDGLMYSLHKPGLVSAGADMYYAILKKLNSEEEWCEIFLFDIIKILNGSSNKAIENFNNYWCSTTVKKFPALIRTLISQMENCKESEQKLYSSLCIMKQANKLGLIKKNWNSTLEYKEIEKAILEGLNHFNSHIRMLAFEILCVSHSKILPTKIEYKLVLTFLHENLNSDCTVLRLSMLNSFSCFMIQVHMAFVNNQKHGQESEQEELLNFCTKFQDLINGCLDIRGNYQRKITTIKLAKIFLQNLNEIPKKRQKQSRQLDTTALEMLKEKNRCLVMGNKFILKLIDLLNDPAEDIRENVIQLLLGHYSSALSKTCLMNQLIDNALGNMRSKFFYEICSGQSLFKLISTILLTENNLETRFKTVEDIFEYACNELTLEYKMERSVLKSIEDGKQLHSFISIIQVVLQVCNQHSYRIKVSNVWELLNALDGISKQFAWDEVNTTSSDFSKISDMVENMIQESGSYSSAENDYTKLSGIHQIVLNCLWLNVKGSCDLSSLLIQYQSDDTQIDICEKCLAIITHVLEICRHKGAIEAAGSALGQCIRHLTSLPADSNISKLPLSLLKCKLEELISETSKMASVTRRGAGLSIMVHRIVSNDTNKAKPLFHYFMKTLLETCQNAVDTPSESDTQENQNSNEKDLPKAIYIHFLTRIVIDSSLASDMMYYSVELAELAFDNLTSPQWQIRNAALQLYGALIPKLIGQKKASGTEEETVATVACDELQTHSPKLWKYIKNQLGNDNYTDKLQYHSNLIPILNLLANMAKRYNFKHDKSDLNNFEVFNSLMSLLGSPIYTVRRLTAKGIYNMYSFESIYDILMKQESLSENFMHGSLMLIKYFFKIHHCNSLYDGHFRKLQSKFGYVLNIHEHSYLCKVLFDDMFFEHSLNIESLKQVFIEADINVHAPCIFLWTNLHVQKYLNMVSWDMIPQIVKIILNRKDFEQYCEMLLVKIEEDCTIPLEVLVEVTAILMSFKDKFDSGVIWKILYQISITIDISGHIDETDIVEYLEENNVSYKLRYMIPFLARIFRDNRNDKILSKISTTIYTLTNSETTDVDMRYIATMANNELSIQLSDLPDTIKITAIKSAVVLLQDEDEDVRNICVHFYRNLNNMSIPPHPYICLFKILDYNFLCTFMNSNAVKELCCHLEDFLFNNTNCNTDNYNPFSNDSKNIYLETEVLKNLIGNLKKNFNEIE